MKAVPAARLSLIAGLVVFGLKWLAFKLTGSAALYSDALESVVNIVAALAALYAVSISRRPPDFNHPFGHTKAEYFSAVIEGVLVVLAALTIVAEASQKLASPQAISNLGTAAVISLGASALNAGLVFFLIRLGRAARSPALVADGQHIFSDVLTSVGVWVGMGLAWATGYWILDPLLALAVATNILRVGWKLVRESVGGLMDEAVPEHERENIFRLVESEAGLLREQGKILEIHDFKTRRAGPRTFAEFHLVVPGVMLVEEAHHICDLIEEKLERANLGVELTIHVEPHNRAKHRTFQMR